MLVVLMGGGDNQAITLALGVYLQLHNKRKPEYLVLPFLKQPNSTNYQVLYLG